jgi:hypothetical protein
VQVPAESARVDACALNGVMEVRVVKQDSVPTPAWLRYGASKYGLELTCSWYSDAVGTGVQRKVGTPAAGSTRPPRGLSGSGAADQPRVKAPTADQRPCRSSLTAATRQR